MKASDTPFPAALIRHLREIGYFDGPSAACMSVMPYVKPGSVGLEIGIYGGDSSRLFLDFCQTLYGIDPCIEYDENPDKGWYTREDKLREAMASWGDRFKFIKGFSSEVSDQIPNDLDWVYIDGNHEFEYVKQDIALYWPKVRSGGFLSGHDYSGGHPGVTRAVDEFAAANGLAVEEHQYCWVIQKP